MPKTEGLDRLARQPEVSLCTDLIASATPAQLTALADFDLWHRSAPGADDQFDVDQFGEWLDALADAGESVAARTIVSLDRGVVIAGLSRYVRVFDRGIFEPTAQSDDELIDRRDAMHEGGGGDSLECEVGGYIVRARRFDAWDAIVAILAELETEYGADFDEIMRGCRRLSNSRPEIDGLNDLFQEPEQQLHEVALERERRRSQQGYATPADARAFLQMARQPNRADVNPIVTAYFREMAEANVDETVETARVREFAFLANVLIEGSSIQGRPFTPEEAVRAVAATCKLGVEHRLPAPGSRSIDYAVIAAFEEGWCRSHHEVRLFVTQQLTPGVIDALEETDMVAWIAVTGLLGECPVMPAAMKAILEGQLTPVSPTAFDFIATQAQIDDVHRFVSRLPDMLGRRDSEQYAGIRNRSDGPKARRCASPKPCGPANRERIEDERKIGWDAGIRTPISRVRVCCPTVERRPSKDPRGR